MFAVLVTQSGFLCHHGIHHFGVEHIFLLALDGDFRNISLVKLHGLVVTL